MTADYESIQHENAQLREWLKKAIGAIDPDRRCTKRFIDIDEAAGSTYELTLSPWIREARIKLGLDPEVYIQ